jgi:hypothetical protein
MAFERACAVLTKNQRTYLAVIKKEITGKHWSVPVSHKRWMAI